VNPTYRVYSVNFGGGITEVFAADSRYKCERHLLNLRRAGRMTHFYRISTLPYDAAKRRYSTES
jgi:hypothetical protein